MDPKGSRKIYLSRTKAEAVAHLENDEIHVLLTKGRELFILLDVTPEAEALLAANPDLSEAVEKW